MDRPGRTVLVVPELAGAGPAIQRRSVMRLVPSRRTLARLAAIFAGGALLALGVSYMRAGEREAINRKSTAPDLRQIKVALDKYVQAHEGVYPPRLEVLSQSGLVDDRGVLADVIFPAAGKNRAELKPSDYVVVQPERPRSENTPPRFALRADGRIEYWRE